MVNKYFYILSHKEKKSALITLEVMNELYFAPQEKIQTQHKSNTIDKILKHFDPDKVQTTIK